MFLWGKPYHRNNQTRVQWVKWVMVKLSGKFQWIPGKVAEILREYVEHNEVHPQWNISWNFIKYQWRGNLWKHLWRSKNTLKYDKFARSLQWPTVEKLWVQDSRWSQTGTAKVRWIGFSLTRNMVTRKLPSAAVPNLGKDFSNIVQTCAVSSRRTSHMNFDSACGTIVLLAH